MTPILGPPTATLDQALHWAVEADCAPLFASVLPTAHEVAAVVGVDFAVLAAQMAHESGFGHFGRAMTPVHYQFGGLKVRDTRGFADDDPRAHWVAPDYLTGILGQVHHLALYAGAPRFPLAGSPDPRHFTGLRATATTVEDLSRRWAGPGYGERVQRVLAGLWATPRLVEL